MLSDAVTSMEEVKHMGSEIEKKQEKNLILTIISDVPFLIPFVGTAVGKIGRADTAIAWMLSIMETGAAAGFGVHEIVEGSKSAPLAIISMLVGNRGISGLIVAEVWSSVGGIYRTAGLWTRWGRPGRSRIHT